MTRHFLAYATANEGGVWFRDLINFRRLARLDPGVPAVEVVVAVSEAHPPSDADARAVGALRRTTEASGRLRLRGVIFKPSSGGDFSSWHACLEAIAAQGGAPEDFVLCLNRSAFGPLHPGWYAEFVRQWGGDGRIALPAPGSEHTHGQPYAFLRTLQEMTRASPGSAALTAVTPFRHWTAADDRRPGVALRRLAAAARSCVQAARDGLLRLLIRYFAPGARSVDLREGHGSLGSLAKGSYLLLSHATEPCGLVAAIPGDEGSHVPFFVRGGDNAHLLALRQPLPGSAVFPAGAAHRSGQPERIDVVRLPAIASLLMRLLSRARAGSFAAYAFGSQRQLLPLAPASSAPGWEEWSRFLHMLWILGLEDATPDSPLMQLPVASGEPALWQDPRAARIGVHLHLHYLDLWPEIAEALRNFPDGVRLFVSASSSDEALFAAIRERYPESDIRVMQNRGRDIAPFLQLLVAGAFDGLDYVCKLHGKKSPDGGSESYLGRAWRRRCIAELCGSPARVRAILERFDADAHVGLIGPAGLRVPGTRFKATTSFRKNHATMAELLERCGASSALDKIEFFAGSMFWFRPRSLHLARALDLAPETFPEEPIPADGTLAHALERVIPTLAVAAGYEIRTLPPQLSAGPQSA